MKTEVTELMGMEVYTDKGHILGTVNDVILDVTEQKIYALYMNKTNTALVEDGVAVAVPYRWVRTVGDVIILKKFPSYISLTSS